MCKCDGMNWIRTYGSCTCEPASAVSAGYARPRTRGELRDLLNSGVACEVVSSNAMFTAQMLQG